MTQIKIKKKRGNSHFDINEVKPRPLQSSNGCDNCARTGRILSDINNLS